MFVMFYFVPLLLCARQGDNLRPKCDLFFSTHFLYSAKRNLTIKYVFRLAFLGARMARVFPYIFRFKSICRPIFISYVCMFCPLDIQWQSMKYDLLRYIWVLCCKTLCWKQHFQKYLFTPQHTLKDRQRDIAQYHDIRAIYIWANDD